MHPHVALLVKAELKKLLDAKFIRPIPYADWISNLVPVSKNSGQIRICTDFRDLNIACPKDDFPLPNIDMIVDLTAGHEMLSLMDGFSGYNQIRIAPEDQHKTAFTCPWGTYCWNVMPFGLKNAGATYQRAMTTIFHDLIHKTMEDYVDDILAKSLLRKDHLAVLGPIFDRMEEYKVRLNPKKCAFGVTAGKLLGFIVSHRGIEVDPAKVKAILDMPPPSNLRQLRGLQGRLQSIRRFIAQLADKCHPFQHLLHKDIKFIWTEQCEQAFQIFKNYLLTTPILVPPVQGRPLLLYISATESALGVLLAQHDDTGKERAIYYLSRTLVGYELNYTSIEKSCLAVVFASQKLRHYMLSHQTKLVAHIDPLKYLLSKAALTGRLAKWVMILSEFDIEYVDRKAIKGQVIADQLAEAPIQDHQPIVSDFPDESIMTLQPAMEIWQLYFDGSCTNHGAGAGIVLVTPDHDTIPKSFRLNFQCTNNIAEYEALVTGLKIAIQWRIKNLKVFGDSQLVISQVNNDYMTKDEKLIPYRALMERLRAKFHYILFEQVPRAQNKAADAMATIASLIDMPGNDTKFQFLVEQLLMPSHQASLTESACVLVGPESPWYQDVYTYLQNNALPQNLSRNQRKAFIRQASRYTILATTLYRRGLDGTLLRCLTSLESQKALYEVHEGICGTHGGGNSLAKKVIRMGYYWPTVETDAHKHVQRCKKCQIHGDLVHAPAQELNPITSPLPFSMWGFDLVGKITPSSANGHKYIIAATEYFTKWVEAIPLTYITGKQIALFMLNYIICRYGIPQTILTDHGTPFQNKDVEDLCEQFHIKQGFSSFYYPQGNGQAEATNKTILKILKKTVNDSGKDWHLQLSPALWAYRTSVRTPTGATPFSLVYGTEAVLPLEVEIPSLRISLKNLISDEDYRVARLNELELLDERRQQAFNHLQGYQNRLRRNYHKKVKPRTFEVGDLVLMENQKNQTERIKPGKFEPNWLGPFVIISSTQSGAFILATPEGDQLPGYINSMHLKRFYP